MAVVKMGSKKRIPEQDYVSRKERDYHKVNLKVKRRYQVSQRETSEGV